MSSTTGRGRRDGDFYETPSWCVELLLPHLGNNRRGGHAIDYGAGTGAITKILVRDGWRVTAVEANPEMCGDLNQALHLHGEKHGAAYTANALEWDEDYHLCVMNPPYSQAEEFVRHALKRCTTVAALLRLSFLASTKRADLWRDHPADVLVLPRRPSFTGRGTDSCDYAWFVWGPGRGGRWQRLESKEVANG